MMTDEDKAKACYGLCKLPDDKLIHMYKTVRGSDYRPTSRKQMIRYLVDNVQIKTIAPTDTETKEEAQRMRKTTQFRNVLEIFINFSKSRYNITTASLVIAKLLDNDNDKFRILFKVGFMQSVEGLLEWANEKRATQDFIDFYEEGIEKIKELVIIVPNETFHSMMEYLMMTTMFSCKRRGEEIDRFETTDWNFANIVCNLATNPYRNYDEGHEVYDSIFVMPNEDDLSHCQVMDLSLAEAPDFSVNESDNVVTEENSDEAMINAMLDNVANSVDKDVIVIPNVSVEGKNRLRDFIKDTQRYKPVMTTTLNQKLWRELRKSCGISGRYEVWECTENENFINPALERKDGGLFRGPIILMNREV
jgi:hypothetical protein